MRVGFGLISCQRTAGDSRTWTDLYRQAIELTRLAEQRGFASVWTTEHHFVDDGYMPSVLVTSAALAAATQSIEIGTGVLLAPLYPPLRLAEDAATVSIISQGRFILGLGLGWSAIEFAAFDAQLEKRGLALDEILAILRQAWSGEIVRHHGSIYDLEEVAVRPVPDAPVPVVIGGGADPAVRRAARVASGFFSNASPDRLLQQIEVAQDEMSRTGRDPSAFRWLYYLVAYPCDDPEVGWREIRSHVWQIRWKYRDMEASARRTGPLSEPPSIDPETDDRLRSATLLGSPEWLADQLLTLRERADVELEIVLRSYFPGLPFDQQVAVIEQLAEVVTRLR